MIYCESVTIPIFLEFILGLNGLVNIWKLLEKIFHYTIVHSTANILRQISTNRRIPIIISTMKHRNKLSYFNHRPKLSHKQIYSLTRYYYKIKFENY